MNFPGSLPTQAVLWFYPSKPFIQSQLPKLLWLLFDLPESYFYFFHPENKRHSILSSKPTWSVSQRWPAVCLSPGGKYLLWFGRYTERGLIESQSACQILCYLLSWKAGEPALFIFVCFCCCCLFVPLCLPCLQESWSICQHFIIVAITPMKKVSLIAYF